MARTFRRRAYRRARTRTRRRRGIRKASRYRKRRLRRPATQRLIKRRYGGIRNYLPDRITAKLLWVANRTLSLGSIGVPNLVGTFRFFNPYDPDAVAGPGQISARGWATYAHGMQYARVLRTKMKIAFMPTTADALAGPVVCFAVTSEGGAYTPPINLDQVMMTDGVQYVTVPRTGSSTVPAMIRRTLGPKKAAGDGLQGVRGTTMNINSTGTPVPPADDTFYNVYAFPAQDTVAPTTMTVRITIEYETVFWGRATQWHVGVALGDDTQKLEPFPDEVPEPPQA